MYFFAILLSIKLLAADNPRNPSGFTTDFNKDNPDFNNGPTNMLNIDPPDISIFLIVPYLILYLLKNYFQLHFLFLSFVLLLKIICVVDLAH